QSRPQSSDRGSHSLDQGQPLLFFICRNEQLNLKPNPTRCRKPTSSGIGTSPRSLSAPISPTSSTRNFKFHHKGNGLISTSNYRILITKKAGFGTRVWKCWRRSIGRNLYGSAAMRIPFSAIDSRPPKPGNTLRINIFRSQGPPGHRYNLAWQPTEIKTF